ncbi:MAG: hydantoinase/oxoprolinase N-terminal domain-containing protein [Woeseiaceae bacterium]|nr:hydantoinase/oxoprolinase N-terminal domain-containing protein [Woeseiaceae bacterium]
MPVISPLPFNANQPANTGLLAVSAPRGSTAVTPVRTARWSGRSRMIVSWPTVTPATSVIGAFSGPGMPSNGMPRSRARTVSAVDSAGQSAAAISNDPSNRARLPTNSCSRTPHPPHLAVDDGQGYHVSHACISVTSSTSEHSRGSRHRSAGRLPTLSHAARMHVARKSASSKIRGAVTTTPRRRDPPALGRWLRADGHAEAPVGAIKMGTTVATNALLERRGTPAALPRDRRLRGRLAATSGHQNRPDIFALDLVRGRHRRTEKVVGIAERIGSDGSVVTPIDDDDVVAALERIRGCGIDAVAICLMHGYRYPAHEARVAALARQAGFTQVSASHEVEPLIKFVSRAETTLVDAYLTPVLGGYIARLRQALATIAQPERLLFMQSSGGLVDAEQFRGKDSILSGPAGGVVGMVQEADRVPVSHRLVGL